MQWKPTEVVKYQWMLWKQKAEECTCLLFVFFFFPLSFLHACTLFSSQLEMNQGKWQVTSSLEDFCPLHQIKRGRRFSGNMDKNKIFFIRFPVCSHLWFCRFHGLSHNLPLWSNFCKTYQRLGFSLKWHRKKKKGSHLFAKKFRSNKAGAAQPA